MGGVVNIGIRVVSALLSLLVTILLARSLGPKYYGVYAYCYSIIAVISIPAQAGLPLLVVRETAKNSAVQNWKVIRGLWIWATAVCGGVSFIIVFSALFVTWVFYSNISELQLSTFCVSLLLVPLIALGNIRSAALRGLQHVVLAELSQSIIRPLFFIFGIFYIEYFLTDEPDSFHAMIAHVWAAVIAFISGLWILYHFSPCDIRNCSNHIFKSRNWFLASVPLALANSMNVIADNVDILMLGIFYSADGVGVYKVAVQLTTLAAFGLLGISMVVAPYFARMHEKNELHNLQRTALLTSRFALLFAILAIGFFYIFGQDSIRILFGSEYQHAISPLYILLIGQFFNAFFGSVGTLLAMTGNERQVAIGVAISTITNIALNFMLIPQFGMIGAATATAVTTFLWNLLLWRSAIKYLNIDTMALSLSAIRGNSHHT